MKLTVEMFIASAPDEKSYQQKLSEMWTETIVLYHFAELQREKNSILPNFSYNHFSRVSFYTCYNIVLFNMYQFKQWTRSIQKKDKFFVFVWNSLGGSEVNHTKLSYRIDQCFSTFFKLRNLSKIYNHLAEPKRSNAKRYL